MAKYYISFDAGTQSVKVVLYNLEMECIARASYPTKVYYPQPGWAEMNVDDYLQAIKLGIRDCVKRAKEKGIDVSQSAPSAPFSVMASSAASLVSIKTSTPSHHISFTLIPARRMTLTQLTR